jgi:hypothetical protein
MARAVDGALMQIPYWDVMRIWATHIQLVANVAFGHPETNGHLSGALHPTPEESSSAGDIDHCISE